MSICLLDPRADRKLWALQNALQAVCKAWGECPQPPGMVRTRDQSGRVTPHRSHSWWAVVVFAAHTNVAYFLRFLTALLNK